MSQQDFWERLRETDECLRETREAADMWADLAAILAARGDDDKAARFRNNARIATNMYLAYILQN